MQKKVPYVAQLGNMDCSIACMTMLFRYYGLDVDIVDVGQVVHIGRDGVNLTQLKQATQQFGFKCTAYRYNKQKNILDSNLPAVVYSGSHLAVIGSKTVLGQYILLDPIKGKSIVNFEQIHDTFSDILITIGHIHCNAIAIAALDPRTTAQRHLNVPLLAARGVHHAQISRLDFRRGNTY